MLARAFVQNLHFSILCTSQNFSQHPKQHSTTSTAMCLLQNKLVGIQFPTLITPLRILYLGRIGSTKLVLPKWHKCGSLNRVIRVIEVKTILSDTNWIKGKLLIRFSFLKVSRSQNKIVDWQFCFEVNWPLSKKSPI